jgi:tetratricopeptide (TPR) repeat protein
MGEFDKAIETFTRHHKLTGHPLKGITGLGHAYGASGNIEKAQECLDKLTERAKIEPHMMLHMDFVVIYTGLREYDKMFYHLEEALKEHSGVFFIKTAAIFKEVRQDPRYNQILKKYGFD